MSEERQLQDYLNDIIESISDIREFTKGMTYEDFTKDRKTIKAVVRSMEIIGEAVNKIPQHIRGNYPEIPWQEIVGMRNKIAHEYFGVDLDIVWQSIEEDFVPLEKTVKKMSHDLYGN
ncbi:MAG TPA: HepT-like ribonuclease domain-containing protein [Candidatus Wujingus californicus]|uniref:HepT-like ribonuclease domain-containing protein n=1 Tax=Candidatus Wujingus californicus TaxID=3367618 RepID=UPI004026D387